MQLSHRASIKRWLGVEKCDYIPNKWCKIVQIWKKRYKQPLCIIANQHNSHPLYLHSLFKKIKKNRRHGNSHTSVKIFINNSHFE